MIGQVYTLGYAADGSDEQVRQLMNDPVMLLLDIRMAARSRWFHQWTKNRLTQQWGERYIHLPQLGNVNYRKPEAPIELQDGEAGFQVILDWLAGGYSVVLLCACASYDRCHRRVVAEQLAARGAIIAESI